MFKSVFTKYITAFMLIIIVSFAMMITIITSVVNTYSVQLKEDMISRASQSAVEYLEKQIKEKGLIDLSSLSMIYGERVQPMLDIVADSTEDILLLVTENSGRILMTGGTGAAAYKGYSVPKTLMDEINNGVEVRQWDTLNGLFDTPYLLHASPIFLDDSSVVGTVFICSSSMTLNPLIEVMVKTVVMASLWVMLAALIAVYFISDRIIGPLKAMSRAAKSFAAGKFDVRVPVTGRDEVAELAVAFNNMADSLNGLENMRNSFVANVSHDLRTPMTTISGFIDSMLAGAIPPEKHDYYLGIIAAEVKRLARLVASLLDISRMQAGDRKFNMTPFDICEMARQIIISFEQLESARWLPYLKKGGVLISSTQRIDPMPVIMGKAEYPENILSKLSEKDIKLVCLDALSLAIEAGTPKCANIVLLGAAVQFLGIEKEMWVDIIRSTVPPKTIDVNLKAFELGYNAN